MAYESPQTTIAGQVAAADLSSHQYKFAVLTSTGVNVAGANVFAPAVIQNKPTSGQAVTLFGAGSISKVVAGAAITRGAQVMSDASGRAITAATGGIICGRALETVTAAGQIVSVLLGGNGAVL